MESTIKFVLPLLGETTGANNQTPLQVPPGNQLLYEQARHDGFTSAGVICQQEPEWLAR
jgi:hypothetical protein